MLIDFHSHFIPGSFPELPQGIEEPAWPRLELDGQGHGTMFTGARKFRAFDDIYWDVPRRLAVMDAAGLDMQVISPLPETLSYWLDAAAAVVLTDAMNEACAAMVAQAPLRLKGFGAVALQNPEAAIRQVADVARMPGMVGIFVGSHVNGKSIASSEFHLVFAAAEKAGLLVFVHGIKPDILGKVAGPPLLEAVLGIPQENALALASFISTDILGKFPELKLVFSHGGGTIGAVIDRMTLVWEKFADMRVAIKIPPLEYARRFWYDTVVFSPEYLGYLIARLGADRIVAGTDGPTEIGQTNLRGFIAATGVDAADQERVGGGNALALFMKTPGIIAIKYMD
ncbi:putative amidohydrolase [Acidocella aquatica]|uniref:Amidohydrolase n=1 Tax=Acidocella aquatica TaxID=1922313 RepID=A0ABQ6A351_9PROT|nr:amidohydrolase family protein [Acidocella aquatica]GLR65685.1 putative amidohydrolase [Acidocella aquatica]